MNKDIVFKDNYKIINYIKENIEIKYLRVCWTDITNKIRCKSINIETLLKGNDNLIYLTISDICMTLLPFIDQFALPMEDLKNKDYGVVYLVPDFSTLTILPYCKSHAQIIGSFYKLNDKNGNLEAWDQCPRQCLIKSINKLSIEHSLSLKGSFEEEFFLIKNNNYDLNNIDFNKLLNDQLNFDSNTACSFQSLDKFSFILYEINESLIKQGIPIEQILKEGGIGQFEFTIKYDNILTACDRHIIFRQTVHAVSAKNGYIASFIPKLYENVIGSGCHAHLSLWDFKNNKNITPDENNQCGISLITQKFIGGILEHSSSISAIFNPTSNSYERLVPSPFNGTTVGWGVDNKGAFCRIPSNPFKKANTNFELKTIDHTSNLYLTISSIIHCGIYGINNNCINISSKSEIINNIKDLNLPTNIIDALNSFNSNEFLKESMGYEISNIFYKVKQSEEKYLSNLSKDEKKMKILQLY